MSKTITLTLTVEEAELLANVLHEHTEFLAENYSEGDLTDEQYETLNTQAQQLVTRLDSLVEDAITEEQEEGA